jgi:hypothetical protein
MVDTQELGVRCDSIRRVVHAHQKTRQSRVKKRRVHLVQ